MNEQTDNLNKPFHLLPPNNNTSNNPQLELLRKLLPPNDTNQRKNLPEDTKGKELRMSTPTYRRKIQTPISRYRTTFSRNLCKVIRNKAGYLTGPQTAPQENVNVKGVRPMQQMFQRRQLLYYQGRTIQLQPMRKQKQNNQTKPITGNGNNSNQQHEQQQHPIKYYQQNQVQLQHPLPNQKLVKTEPQLQRQQNEPQQYPQFVAINKQGQVELIVQDQSKQCSERKQLALEVIIDKLQDRSWECAIQGLYELLRWAPTINWLKHERELMTINRKLIDFFRSPRSAMCRMACQVAGEMFRIAKSVRRPEFDDIVEILLNKTGDINRFTQQDANIALDKMVTYIPSFHSVRAVCGKGPVHKNNLVRTATARLLTCICVISGLDNILGINANKHTRKRILSNLGKFLTDKNPETRRYGERMYKILRKHTFFQEHFFKDIESNHKFQMEKIINSISLSN